MANYKLSPAAEDDLYRIWLYGLETWGEDAADQYVQGLLACFQKIADSPYQYPEVNGIRAGYQRCVYKVAYIKETLFISGLMNRLQKLWRLLASRIFKKALGRLTASVRTHGVLLQTAALFKTL